MTLPTIEFRGTPLEVVDDRVIIRPMLTIRQAIELYVDGHLVDLGRAERTRDSYGRILDKFADRFPRNWDVAKITVEDCRSFLALYHSKSRGYRATVYAPLNGLFEFLAGDDEFIKRSPMHRVPAPRRPRPEDLDVVTLDMLEVSTLIREARPGTERNCIAILAYTGGRRRSVSRLRLSDYRDGRIRFYEKGGKVSWKLMSDELCEILDASIARGEISASAPFQPDDPYLIPPGGKLARRDEDGRDDRIVWNIVKTVAGRCGVKATTHAFRRAFAVFYLLENRGDTRGLGKLMGHKNPATTEIYARHLDDEIAMEPVRGLSWLGNRGLDADLHAEVRT